MSEQKYLDNKQTREYLGKSTSTIYRMVQNKVLKPVKHGGKVMYRKSDLDRVMEKGWNA